MDFWPKNICVALPGNPILWWFPRCCFWEPCRTLRPSTPSHVFPPPRFGSPLAEMKDLNSTLGYAIYPCPYLRKWQKSFAFDVTPDLVDRGGELVHLPFDVVGHTLRKLGQVSFVLQNWRHHLKSRENCQISDQQSRVSPNDSFESYVPPLPRRRSGPMRLGGCPRMLERWESWSWAKAPSRVWQNRLPCSSEEWASPCGPPSDQKSSGLSPVPETCHQGENEHCINKFKPFHNKNIVNKILQTLLQPHTNRIIEDTQHVCT